MRVILGIDALACLWSESRPNDRGPKAVYFANCLPTGLSLEFGDHGHVGLNRNSVSVRPGRPIEYSRCARERSANQE